MMTPPAAANIWTELLFSQTASRVNLKSKQNTQGNKNLQPNCSWRKSDVSGTSSASSWWGFSERSTMTGGGKGQEISTHAFGLRFGWHFNRLENFPVLCYAAACYGSLHRTTLKSDVMCEALKSVCRGWGGRWCFMKRGSKMAVFNRAS